jgi:signal transduction histidine kinase
VDYVARGPDDLRQLEDRFRVLSLSLRSFAEATADYPRLLDVVASNLAEIVKDGCVVRLLEDGGWLSPVAIHMPIEEGIHDPSTIARLRAHMATRRNVSEQASARRVLETGEALLVPRVDLEQLRASSSPEVVRAYETIGIHSLLFVALRVRGESLGLLALVRFLPTSPPFNEQDRELAQVLADHAALAITNAQLLQSALRELGDRERAEAALRETEEQLLHAQKMEAVGRLAGGVAHDFNNALSVILSYAEILGGELPSSETLRHDLEEIRTAALRAADLTKQLLAFSRRQVVQAKVLSLGKSVVDIETMLRRLLGADIELTVLGASGQGNIRANPGQIEQVLMNLAINARDAMPEGGRLTIETSNVDLDADYAAAHHDVAPGRYVLLAMSDTGFGMEKATQARIFEPFFTTKETGKGTGLGLSTVFGIVKQAGGHIWLYSEPGQGTTFKVYFPRIEGPADERVVEVPVLDSDRGHETILLVEDDDQVRTLARNILRRAGYVVLESSNGGEALLVSEQHASRIDLLLTDVVLPRMSGRQLAERLAPARPNMKILFTSGYTDDAIIQHGVLDSGIAYLEKPLTPRALLNKVRQVLVA